jgi:hypothetical protein
MTNSDRADRASHAVQGYCDGEFLGPDEGVQDLINDLGHYCDRHGLDFHKLCARAIAGHAGEKSDTKNNEGWETPQVIITVGNRVVADLDASPEWETANVRDAA